MRKILLALTLTLLTLPASSIVIAAGSACAGNLVWVDSDGNGIKSGNEKGLRSVAVNLLDNSGQVLDRVVSSNGYFKLCTLDSGFHQISVDIPNGYKVAPQWQGNSEYHDSDAEPDGTVSVELKQGRNITKYDIGLVPTSTRTELKSTISATDDVPAFESPRTKVVVNRSNTNSQKGVLFGPWVETRHRNDGVFGTFNAALLAPTTRNILEVLSDAEATDTKVIIQLGSAGEWGWNFATGNSTFTMQKWKRSVQNFSSNPIIKNAIKSAINKRLIRAFYLIDEPHHTRWSPSHQYNHITNADIDEMARYIKSYWPTATTAVRASPRTLNFYGRQTHHWKYLDQAFLMVNYRKWATQGAKTLDAFMEREIAEANKQGLGLIGSVQMLIGAPTSDTRFWPDQGRNGASPVGKLKVSPVELKTYVDAFLKRRNTAGELDSQGTVPFDTIMVFRWDRNNERDWQDPHYWSAISELNGYLQTK